MKTAERTNPTIRRHPQRDGWVILYWPHSGGWREAELHRSHDGEQYVLGQEGYRFYVAGIPAEWSGKEIECELEAGS